MKNFYYNSFETDATEEQELDWLDDIDNLTDTLDNVKRVQVLPYHTLGKFKWEKLGIPYSLSDVPTPTSEQIQRAEAILAAKNNL